MIIITLDGPTASGKSTIARALAQQLTGIHFNSGLMYRTIGYVASQQGFTKESIHTISHRLVQEIVSQIIYEYTDQARIVYANTDITHLLKVAHVDALASCVSELAHVRAVINEYARSLKPAYALVADGRDCGTVMFPQAHYKFFITAPLEVRAQRWQHDQQKHGKFFSITEALQQVLERDTRDSQRTVAPLKKAHDAIVIDTSQMTFDQVMKIIKETL